tara:strand:- start:1943 stop:2251 length:309 start_codon:yes stop_codon:yes gene_type:complete
MNNDWLEVPSVQDDFALTSPYASDDDAPPEPEVTEPEEPVLPVPKTMPDLPPALPLRRAAPAATPTPVHLWFGVIVIMAVLRIIGTSPPLPSHALSAPWHPD